VDLARAAIIACDLAEAAERGMAAQWLLTGKARSLAAVSHLLVRRAYGGLGQSVRAEGVLRSLRIWLEPLPNSRRVASTWYAAAETAELLGDEDASVEAYQRALACAGL